MDRRDYILAALAAGKGGTYSPVQVQKLLFLADNNISSFTGGPQFNFQPYNYGPFDKAVYSELDALAAQGLVTFVPNKNWNDYVLTPAGQAKGEEVLKVIGDKPQGYLQRASQFVRSVSFSQLVTAIYKAYPAMRVNSVFNG